jgi:hypothetical protein
MMLLGPNLIQVVTGNHDLRGLKLGTQLITLVRMVSEIGEDLKAKYRQRTISENSK